jgi:hypothetical protein
MLSGAIRRFLSDAKKGGWAIPARALESLEERLSKELDGGSVALVAPAAPYTWEMQAVLQGTANTTGRVPVKFPRPVEVLGFIPTIITQDPAAGGVDATLDDVSVLLDVDQKDRMTNRLDQTTGQASTDASSFVTLRAMSILLPRAMRWQLNSAKPDLGVTFAWKIPPVGGIARYRPALISLAMVCRFIEE